MFKWSCFSVGFVFAVVALWLVIDLRQNVVVSLDAARKAVEEANATVTLVNEQLPGIVAEVKQGTQTLAGLAEDVELLKRVAGIRAGGDDPGFRGLAKYADEVQQVLERETLGRDATIWIEKIAGSELKRVETVEEFMVGLSREMVALILPTAKSKQEVLYRICHSGPPRRKPFHIRLGADGVPEPLEDFLKWHHKESGGLPEYVRD